MSRPKLSSPDQPLPLRLVLRLYERAASLSLAVTLIFSSAFTLGLATFVEAAYGTPVVQFYVYQTWWFEILLVLLAGNIFCAASIRYPWKRHQTGFVITHIGLLTLLFGAYISRSKGIDAQVTVFEGQMSKWAIENAVKLELMVNRPGESSPASERIEVEFEPGLFNWQDWDQQFAFNKPEDDAIQTGRLPWKLFRAGTGALFTLVGQNRPGDVLYERDGVKLEVLDYYADSRDVQAPHLKFQVSLPQDTRIGPDGRQKAKAVQWMPQEISVISPRQLPQYPYGWSRRQPAGGGYYTIQLAGTKGATEAFLKCLPQGELGEKGQAVLYAGGKVTRVDVAEKLGSGRFKLEGTEDLEAEVTEYWPTAELAAIGENFDWQQVKEETKPTNPAVKIAVYRGDKKLSDLLLLALESQSNQPDYRNDIYGAYWFNHGDNGVLTKDERLADSISARIDFLQGADEKLYYRCWNREKILYARELPTDGSPEDAVDGFTMPIGTLKLYVTQFIPSDKPQVVPAKHEFIKDRLIGDPMQGGRQPVAKFALTVDGEREEFWLFPHLATPENPPTNRPDDGQRIHLANGSSGRIAALTMPIDATDIGFRVRLNKFERKLDPGTEQASHYASWVDFVDHDSDRAVATLEATGRKPEMTITPELRRPSVLGLTTDGEDVLYVMDERAAAIREVELKTLAAGKPGTALDKGVRKPSALVVAPNGTVYFSDRVPVGRKEMGVIRTVDSSGKTETLAQLKAAPDALALDSDGGHLYFAGRGMNAIGRITLATQDVDETWYTGSARPVGNAIALTLDAAGERLLWSEAGRNAIRHVKLDGSRDGLLLSRGKEEQPLSLAVDAQAERVYFLESLPNPQEDKHGRPTSKPLRWRLMSAQLDGKDVRIECDEGIDEPQALAITGGGRPIWTQTATTRTDVWITMNAPVDCFDPQTGRSYRLFQERFSGPYKPGQQLFSGASYEDLVSADSAKSELYESVLTVNYDPGRGIRNVGCFLVCLGIATMFYMRAYFFKKPKGATAERAASPAVAPRTPKKQRALAGQSKGALFEE